MEYDPKLKKAMAEIGEIMKKYDIGGYIVLAAPPFVEYKHFLRPSWSCAFVDHIGGQEAIRFRTRLKEDYGGNVERRNAALDITANMIHNMSGVIGMAALGYMDMTDQLEKTLGLTKGEGGSHTGETGQNN